MGREDKGMTKVNHHFPGPHTWDQRCLSNWDLVVSPCILRQWSSTTWQYVLQLGCRACFPHWLDCNESAAFHLTVVGRRSYTDLSSILILDGCSLLKFDQERFLGTTLSQAVVAHCWGCPTTLVVLTSSSMWWISWVTRPCPPLSSHLDHHWA